VAWIDIAIGLLSILEITVALAGGRISLNLGVLGIFIGHGLLRRNGPTTIDRSPVRAKQGSASPQEEGPPGRGWWTGALVFGAALLLSSLVVALAQGSADPPAVLVFDGWPLVAVCLAVFG